MLKFQEKAVVMNEVTARRAIERMAYEIMEKEKEMHSLVLIGIQTRGVALAKAIAEKIKAAEGMEVPVGSLDITFYRDDLTMLSEHPVIRGNDIAFPVQDKRIVLVDDVLYTGRTIRAAIEELFDMGRPAKIELAILIDRGHRELPIRADYIGKNAPTSNEEYIEVEMNEQNKVQKVSICSKGGTGKS